MIDSTRLKLETMHWLRFGKRLPIVCSEFGWNYRADIIGIGPQISVEVETKISKSDLKRDFTDKRGKHAVYGSGSAAMFTPSYFYFLVPEKLVDETKGILSEQGKKYGILIFEDGGHPFGENLTVVKKAQKLHDKAPTAKMVHEATMRMSSELVTLHSTNREISLNITQSIKDLTNKAQFAAVRATGCLDFEEEDETRFIRAAELAFCVQNISLEQFRALDKIQQEPWLEASRKYEAAKFYGDADLDWMSESLNLRR